MKQFTMIVVPFCSSSPLHDHTHTRTRIHAFHSDKELVHADRQISSKHKWMLAADFTHVVIVFDCG
jgi:hypothetical protein